jgi:drug/metabolite transporter (DMT)-like permease
MDAHPTAGVRSTPVGAAAVLTAVTAWSFINVIVKLTHLPPITFVFYRLWLGSMVMVVALTASHRRLTWATIRASIPGGVLFGLNVVFFVSALRKTAVADVLLIAALQPALTMLVAGRWFGERVTRVEVGWAIASVGGVVLATIGSSGSPIWSLTGDLLAAGALFAWTSYFLVSKHARRNLRAIDYLTAVTLIAAVMVTPLALLSGERLGGVRVADWGWLLLFILGAQGGHLLVAWAHRQVDVSVSALLVLAEPVISALAALAVLGEPIAGLQIAGGLLVMASVAGIVRRSTRAARRDRDAATGGGRVPG